MVQRFQTAAVFAVLFLLAGLTAPAAHAQSASSWSKRGADAEVREDYDTAFEDYRKANQKAPKDLRYKTHLERMRFLAATQHVDRGRVLRANGDYTGAIHSSCVRPKSIPRIRPPSRKFRLPSATSRHPS